MSVATPSAQVATASRPAPAARGGMSGGLVLLYALLAAAFVLVNHHRLWHTDIWGHLKFGEYIATHQALPEAEPFLAEIQEPLPYSATAWLSQVIFYRVFTWGEQLTGALDAETRWAGGVEALRLLHALLVVAKFGLLAWAFFRLTQSWWVAAAFVAVALGLSYANIFVLRPQLFGEVGFALLLVVLARPYPSAFAVFGMPLVFFLWSNLHGSFLLGLITLLGFALGRMLNICIRCGVHPRHYWNDHRFHRMVPMMYLSVLLIGFLHPQGFGVFADVWNFSQAPNVLDMDEWKPLEWNSPWGIAFFLSLLLILATHLTGLWVAPPEDRPDKLFGPIPLGQLILLVCFGLQTLAHQRMMPWWTMLVPWICAGPWGHAVWSLTHPPGGVALPPSSRRLIWGTAAAWALLALLFSGAFEWLRTGQPRTLDQAVHEATPLELVRCLSGQQATKLPKLEAWFAAESGRFPGHIFASETQGEFLLWALPRELAPPAYTHVHLLPQDHWDLVKAVRGGLPPWREILDRWRSNLIVVEAELHPDLRRALYADTDWEVILDEFGDANKRDPLSRLLIAVRKQPLR